MTIQDAITRAKLMHKARVQEKKQAPGAGRDSAEPTIPAQVDHGSARLISESVAPLEPLKTVEISAVACERNRVLLTDEQLRTMGQADTAYRMLRSRVQQRLKRDNWSTLAVTSPGKDDGKTLTSLNLAISIARDKQRQVYLLDLDMRNPSVCKYLGLEGMRPLPDYFVGDAKPEDVLAQTSFPYLNVAGALEPVTGASEMLAGPRLEQLIAHIHARSPGAAIIIDLPPARLSDEAVVVAPRVDALLIVVCEGKTPRDDLTRTLSVLGDFTIAGVIVNQSSDRHVARYDQYYG